tara:strand:+ start:689 stop:1312 length:624 start_codon:yes stop_codon:yes gene_type:complete
MSDTENDTPTLKETIEEIKTDLEYSGDEGESTKAIQKPKKPRSEAQKNALLKAQEARKMKTLKKKEDEQRYFEDTSYLKNLTKKQRDMLKKMALAENEENEEIRNEPIQKRTRKPKVVYEDDPSSDEEVVIVRRRAKPKKKTKPKKVVYEDEYSTESDDDDEIVKDIQKKSNKIEKQKAVSPEPDEFDDFYDYEPQPLTYGSIGRFL